jgi:hypothetical protein
MKIRSTLTLIAINVGVVVNFIQQEIPSQAQITAPISKNDKKSQYTSFATAGIKLIRPEGFESAENFDGFQQTSTQSSVMATTIPGPFSKVTSGFNTEQLKARGMILNRKENILIDGSNGILINLTQAAYGVEFAKWIIIFGNEKETKIVTATFPKAQAAKLSPILKSAVLSARNDSTPPPTLGSDVGFKIAASSKLKLTRVISKMLMYTKDGTIPAKSPEDPLFIVAPSFSEVAVFDRKEFATRRLSQTTSIKINSVTSTDAVAIDGLDGYEIVADAQDSSSDTPITVYQVMLFDHKSYILIQGIVGTNLRDKYLSEFKSMARSFKKQRK